MNRSKEQKKKNKEKEKEKEKEQRQRPARRKHIALGEEPKTSTIKIYVQFLTGTKMAYEHYSISTH